MVLVLATFVAGCGGQAAHPVDRYIAGDENKSCQALNAEMAQIDRDIVLKKKSKTNRDIANIACFVGGWFIIVPWFFIDVKGSQEIEMEALKTRKNALGLIHADKNCASQEGGTSGT